MADIEKMREIFEAVLIDLETSESEKLGNGVKAEQERNELRERCADRLARFNEAVMAKQNEQPIVVNVTGALLQSEDELMKRVNEAIKEAIRHHSIHEGHSWG